MIIYRVDRYKEYAPIKNDVGIDSLESVREKYKKCEELVWEEVKYWILQII